MIVNYIKSAFLGITALVAFSINSSQGLLAQDYKGNESYLDSTKVEYIIPGTSIKTIKLFSPSFNASVNGDEISIPSSNINNMLFGRIPGLIVSESNGEPGYDAATLRIRGLATFNNSSIPVYVDGFQTNSSYLRFISPSEIESIEILKDAAALAPFGIRGANGVIWVTTKRGNIGKAKITAQIRGGLQQPISINKPLGTNDYVSLYNEARSNDMNNVWFPFYTENGIDKLPNVDWHDEVLRNHTPYTDADFSVRGGDKMVRYFVLFGYMGQRGLYDVTTNDTLANAGINRYNIRTNLDINLFNFLEAKVDLGGRIEDRRYPNRTSSNLWNEMSKYPSLIYPIRNENGTYTGTPIFNYNPVASINALGRTSTHDRTFMANFQLKEKLDFLVKGLYISEGMSLSSWTRDGAGNTRNYARYLNGVKQTTDNDTPYNRSEDSGQNQWNWQHYTGTVGYDQTFGRHVISSSANVLYNVYKTDFSANGNAGKMIMYRHINVSGGVNYAYDNRYVATFAFSESGSDNYQPGNRWGFYPSFAAGWIASNESALKDSKVINFLKVRASVGKNGWDPMGEKRYLWQSYYNSQGGMNTGNGTPSWRGGISLMYVPNPDIFAEKSIKYDFGVDLKLINRLSLNLDLFLEKRSDIVTQDWVIPATAGVTNPPYRNIGKVTNQGFEVQLSWTDKVGSFNYFINGMASYNTNKIDYMAEVITLPSAARTGQSIGSMFGYIADGFYDITDFDDNGNLTGALPTPTFGAVHPGDVKYKNLNGDMVVDENDQSWIGNSYLPKIVYSTSLGVNFKGFDIFALFEGISGREVNLLDAPIQNIAFRDNGNVFEIAKGRWAYYPELGIDTRATANYPRLSLLDNNNNYRNSTLWKRNGDYFKLRNLELGYTLPQKRLKSTGISNIRLFVSGVNILTVSELMRDYDVDPEVLSGYPAMKSYNVGLTLTF